MLFRNSRKLRISLIVLILRRNDTKGPSIFDLEEGRGGRRNRDWTAPTSSVQAMAVAPRPLLRTLAHLAQPTPKHLDPFDSHTRARSGGQNQPRNGRGVQLWGPLSPNPSDH